MQAYSVATSNSLRKCSHGDLQLSDPTKVHSGSLVSIAVISWHSVSRYRSCKPLIGLHQFVGDSTGTRYSLLVFDSQDKHIGWL